MSGLKAKLKRSMHGLKGRDSGEISPSSARKSGDFLTPPRHSEEHASSSASPSQPAQLSEKATILPVHSDSSSLADDHQHEKFSTPNDFRTESPVHDHPLPPLPTQAHLDFGFDASHIPPASEQPLTGFDYRDHSVRDVPPSRIHANGFSTRDQRSSAPEADGAAAGSKHDTTERSVKLHYPNNAPGEEKPLPPVGRPKKSMEQSDHVAQAVHDVNLNEQANGGQRPEGKSLPPGFDLTNTEDTTYDVEQAPAVTHEVVHHQVHEIFQERITRDIHVDHVYNYIQPINVVEIAPARHFLLDVKTGNKVPVSAPKGWRMPDVTLQTRPVTQDFTDKTFAPQEYHNMHVAHQDNVGASSANAQYLQQTPTRQVR